jgi:D-methionine transport system ATP-binding protein
MAEIKIENVSKTYSSKEGTVQALKNVSLTIRSGEIYGIIGMSGAGKSTLVRCMNFLEQPTSGNVLIKGRALGGLKEKELRKQREQIGMIFQHFNLLMQKSVLENVCFPMYIQGKKKKEAREKAEELLEIVGLKEKANAFPSQLSGGQKQRVAIARALATSPKILLCDEATSALDPQTTASILELLQEINRKFNITIVIITHQMSVVRKICSHVAIMKSGEIVETGSVSEIFSHPKSDVARELIRKDEGDDISRAESSGNTKDLIQSGRKVRIVFSEIMNLLVFR